MDHRKRVCHAWFRCSDALVRTQDAACRSALELKPCTCPVLIGRARQQQATSTTNVNNKRFHVNSRPRIWTAALSQRRCHSARRLRHRKRTALRYCCSARRRCLGVPPCNTPMWRTSRKHLSPQTGCFAFESDRLSIGCSWWRCSEPIYDPYGESIYDPDIHACPQPKNRSVWLPCCCAVVFRVTSGENTPVEGPDDQWVKNHIEQAGPPWDGGGAQPPALQGHR